MPLLRMCQNRGPQGAGPRGHQGIQRRQPIGSTLLPNVTQSAAPTILPPPCTDESEAHTCRASDIGASLTLRDCETCKGVASSSGAKDRRQGWHAAHEQRGSCRSARYAAPSIARSAADRVRYCSRWTPGGTTSCSMMRCRK